MIARTVSSAMLLAACCAILITQESTTKLSDAEIAKLVVGKWSQDRKFKETEIKATQMFFKDGTFKSQGTLKTGEDVQKLAFTGTWKVSDGFLIQVIETSDPPTLKKGHVSKDCTF